MYRCAFYEKEVTPPLGGVIPGYYQPDRFATGVLDRLYVKAVLFDDGKNQAAMLVFDAVELKNDFCQKVAERVYQTAGIASEQLVMCANHSHYGIPNGELYSGAIDEEYMSILVRLAADCIVLAQQRLQPCTLTFGIGKVPGVSFNRDYVMSTGHVYTNVEPTAPGKVLGHYSESDPVLPVLYAKDESGKPIGALISFACHQDTIGGAQYSGDYSSELSYRLKDQYGHDFVSIYVPGASGDINHLDRISFINGVEHEQLNHRIIGQRIAKETVRVISNASEPLADGAVLVAKKTVQCLCRRATREQLELATAVVNGENSAEAFMLGKLQAEILLKYEKAMESSGKIYADVPVQVIKVGDITIFGMPGEMYHQYGIRLRESRPEEKALVATLCNGAYGYIPVPELFGTDVYPVQLCDGSYLEPEAGNKVTNLALTMSEELDNK